jgi:hypothetical protein
MQPTDAAAAGPGPAFFAVFSLVILAMTALILAAQWKIYVKAGKPGWACLIPFYNIWVLIEIIEKPAWWFLFIFVPILNFLPYIKLAHKFGRSTAFGLGLIFLSFIFFPILGFGDAAYKPDGAAPPQEA